MRWKITIEYDGSNLHGWQKQENSASVQEYLEAALYGFSHIRTTIHAAGRTDAGVHARGQVAHFDLPDSLKDKFQPDNITAAFNAHLQCRQIAVLEAQQVKDDFNARINAIQRIYQYSIIQRKPHLTLDRFYAWRVGERLDYDGMQMAAQNFIGKHDFTTFRAAACQAQSPIRNLDILDIAQIENKITITAAARSFLHHQVRNITGTLVAVGRGKIPPHAIKDLLQARNRCAAPATAPAHGLCLSQVLYD